MTLEISTSKIYRGPSIYARQPVIRFAMAQPLPSLNSAGLAGLCQRLPGLRTHAGTCGTPDCMAQPEPGHLFEHICIELQNLVGGELSCVRAEALSPLDGATAIVPFDDSEVCIAAATLASDLLDACRDDGEPAPDAEHAADLDRKFQQYIALATELVLPVQDRAMVKTARARDIPVAELVGRFLAFGQGRYQQRLSASSTSLTNSIASHLAANKTYTHRVLEAAGLPMARYGRVYSAREAVAAARRIGYPVVVKPNSESMGAAVSVGMKNRREVVTAYRRARKLTRSVIVEELIPGNDYRLLVVGGKLVAAVRRVPGHVVGDGRHTVEELVAEVNRDPRRGASQTCVMTRIDLDEQADRLLAELGYTRASVPAAGEIVNLRRNANISGGGTSVDVTDEVHPDNRAVAERAARAIGLDVAGVDILCRDISESLWDNDGRICEINSRPGLRSHLWPTEGKPRDVLASILDMLFPPGRPTRIPVVAITGNGDTRTTARMLAHLLATAGYRVGLAVGRRVWSGSLRVGRSKWTPPEAARMILLDPDVDVAVLELRPAEVLRHGLGCDTINVTAVINAPQEPAAGAQAETGSAQLLDAIRVVARSTRDIVYLDDGDACISVIERDSIPAGLCRVIATRKGQRPAGQARGSRRVVQDSRVITIYERERESSRVSIASVLKDLYGTEAPSYMQSALYAVVAAHRLGMAPGDIDQGLRSFQPQRPSTKAPREESRRRRSRPRSR